MGFIQVVKEQRKSVILKFTPLIYDIQRKYVYIILKDIRRCVNEFPVNPPNSPVYPTESVQIMQAAEDPFADGRDLVLPKRSLVHFDDI